jgi:hypothetical protein
MANDSRDLRQSAILTLGELEDILSNISHDKERWLASLHWPFDPEDVWWLGGSVFVSHTSSQSAFGVIRRTCFRFPAFPGDHSDDSATLVCAHSRLIDLVWTGELSREERRRFDAFDAFHRFWDPIGRELSVRNSNLHSDPRRSHEGFVIPNRSG